MNERKAEGNKKVNGAANRKGSKYLNGLARYYWACFGQRANLNNLVAGCEDAQESLERTVEMIEEAKGMVRKAMDILGEAQEKALTDAKMHEAFGRDEGKGQEAADKAFDEVTATLKKQGLWEKVIDLPLD